MEIKPCKYCGSMPSIDYFPSTNQYMFECPDFDCYETESYYGDDAEEAINKWNLGQESSDLKPCPWCGHLPYVSSISDRYGISCINADCPINVVVYDNSINKVKEKWNHREEHCGNKEHPDANKEDIS